MYRKVVKNGLEQELTTLAAFVRYRAGRKARYRLWTGGLVPKGLGEAIPSRIPEEI